MRARKKYKLMPRHYEHMFKKIKGRLTTIFLLHFHNIFAQKHAKCVPISYLIHKKTNTLLDICKCS